MVSHCALLALVEGALHTAMIVARHFNLCEGVFGELCACGGLRRAGAVGEVEAVMRMRSAALRVMAGLGIASPQTRATLALRNTVGM